jgi:homogentisate 1,2-dioxygenase
MSKRARYWHGEKSPQGFNQRAGVYRQTPYADNRSIFEHATDEVISSMARGDSTPQSLKINALLIRTYGQPAIDIILTKRAESRKWQESTQRKWQHSTSRRPQRNNHADTWATREGYMRATLGSPVSF